MIFRLPSPSVTMCETKIDSRTVSTPIEVFILLVNYRVGTTLSRFGVDLSVGILTWTMTLSLASMMEWMVVCGGGFSYYEGDPRSS